MTDNEIIKALECCIKHTECPKCPMKGTRNCMSELNKYALDLINRQKAEIERLQHEILDCNTKFQELQEVKEQLEKAENLNDALGNDVDIKLNHIYDLEEKLAQAKSEAIREFDYRLWNECVKVMNLNQLDVMAELREKVIKEMVGDEDA